MFLKPSFCSNIIFKFFDYKLYIKLILLSIIAELKTTVDPEKIEQVNQYVSLTGI